MPSSIAWSACSAVAVGPWPSMLEIIAIGTRKLFEDAVCGSSDLRNKSEVLTDRAVFLTEWPAGSALAVNVRPASRVATTALQLRPELSADEIGRGASVRSHVETIPRPQPHERGLRRAELVNPRTGGRRGLTS